MTERYKSDILADLHCYLGRKLHFVACNFLSEKDMFLRLCYMQVKGGSPPTSTMLERFQCSWPLLVVVQKYTHMLFCLPRSPADSLLGLVTSGPHGCASAELRRCFFQCQTSKSWGRRISFYKCWFHFCSSFGRTFAPRNWAHQMGPPDLELISSPKSRPTF